jgi:hypothetical protein
VEGRFGRAAVPGGRDAAVRVPSTGHDEAAVSAGGGRRTRAGSVGEDGATEGGENTSDWSGVRV